MPTRPPSDITPKVFFEEWLPAQLASGAKGLEPMTVRAHLEGDGGGAWDLRLHDAGLAVAAAGASEADVTMKQTVADWRAVVVGEAGAPNLAPENAAPQDLLMIDARAQQMLKMVKGTFRFEVTQFNGRTWAMTVKIGTQPLALQPNATISVDADTVQQMLAKKLPAPAAFFSGKIKLIGDTNLAMQFGMAMMSRFQ